MRINGLVKLIVALMHACLNYRTWGVALMYTPLLIFSRPSMAENMVFKAVIAQGTCAMSFTNGSGTDISNLPMGDIKSSGIANQKVSPESKMFNIKLTSCGLANSATTPSVRVTGVNPDTTDISAGGEIRFKFRNKGAAGGESREYFVVFGKEPVLRYIGYSQSNKDGLFATYSPYNVVWEGTKGTNGEGAIIPFYASVACDSACNLSTTRAGTLNASLEFVFEYK